MSTEFMELVQETKVKVKYLKELLQGLKRTGRVPDKDCYGKVESLLKTDPAAAANLMTDILLDSVLAHIVESRPKVVWKNPPVQIQDAVIAQLREHGLRVEAGCGHGHGWETPSNTCDGTTYKGSCWREVEIHWDS